MVGGNACFQDALWPMFGFFAFQLSRFFFNFATLWWVTPLTGVCVAEKQIFFVTKHYGVKSIHRPLCNMGLQCRRAGEWWGGVFGFKNRAYHI